MGVFYGSRIDDGANSEVQYAKGCTMALPKLLLLPYTGYFQLDGSVYDRFATAPSLEYFSKGLDSIESSRLILLSTMLVRENASA